MEWQQISTAPKDDGVQILGWDGETIEKTWIGWEDVYVYSDCISWEPTHWMPLPKPPEL